MGLSARSPGRSIAGRLRPLGAGSEPPDIVVPPPRRCGRSPRPPTASRGSGTPLPGGSPRPRWAGRRAPTEGLSRCRARDPGPAKAARRRASPAGGCRRRRPPPTLRARSRAPPPRSRRAGPECRGPGKGATARPGWLRRCRPKGCGSALPSSDLLHYGDPHGELGPVSGVAPHRDLPVVLLHDIVGDAEAQPRPRPFADLLRGEEWLEDPVHVLLRDPLAGVGDGDADV